VIITTLDGTHEVTWKTVLSGDAPETWLLVKPAQDRRQVLVELTRDCIEVAGAVQSQEENVFLGEGDLELIGVRRYRCKRINARSHVVRRSSDTDTSWVLGVCIQNKKLIHSTQPVGASF
jgi:hypothetical protein